jgi:DNA-binding XRE family transcriptional regulator
MMYSLIEIEKVLIHTKEKIRNERIALELTQKEFAKFVDIKYATYRAFEQEGKISFENLVKILVKLNKISEFNKFLDGFEYDNNRKRANIESKGKNTLFAPIVSPLQKQIVLDKNVFGNDLFYSVENGYTYEVSTFITIILSKWDDERLMLLIKYFGIERLKPYILKQSNQELLKSFNKHVAYIEKKVISC